jgi:glycosyltransferase involved in cell wall biosynthesis
MIPLESITLLDYPNYEVYYNIETKDKDNWKDLIAASYPRLPKLYYDFWNYESNWWKKPEYDQDQARLVPIVRGRNDAIECALDVGAEYILFVDSDMVIPQNTIKKLMSHNKPMVGGYVPGRNEHKNVHYIFGDIKDLDNDLKECDFGNIGFVLIKWELFSKLRFRRGPDRIKGGDMQSDDPNYCFDALYNGFGRYYIDTSVRPTHIDDNVLDFKSGAQY